MVDTNSEYATILGADAKFKGDLSFDSTAKLVGSFEGAIKGKGKIFIADGSNCKASVSAKEVAVEGHIQGDVQATERVEIMPSGRITGDIIAARMSMADGASIDGHVQIGPNGLSGPKASAAAEMKPGARTQSVSPAQAARAK